LGRCAELLVTAYALLSLTLLGGVLGYYFEASTKNPGKNITSLSESLYWCIVTITTVGYGDLHPVSTGGEILSMFISLAGVLMFALPAGILGSGFVVVMQQHLQHEEEEQSKQIARLIVLVEQLSKEVKSNQDRVEGRLAAMESRLGTQRGGS
jgi:voltage-gated potassium channel